MRRHLQPTPQPALQLSLEEEAIVADEINQHLMEVADAATATDRLGDIIISMGDVEVVAINEPKLGQVEGSLISSVADMAVAGTDADPEAVLAGLLPANGVSAESFGEKVKNALAELWKKIQAMIKIAWENIKRFFSRIGDLLSPRKHREEKARKQREAEDMLKAADDAKAFAEAVRRQRAFQRESARTALHNRLNVVTLSSGVAARLTEFHGSSNAPNVQPNRLVEQLDRTIKINKMQHDILHKGLTELATVLSHDIEQILTKPTAIAEFAEKLSENYNVRFGLLFTAMEKTRGGKDCLYSAAIGYSPLGVEKDAFMGMRRAEFRSGNAVELHHTPTVNVPPLTAEATDKILDLIEAQRKELEKMANADVTRELEAAVQRLDKAISRLTTIGMWEEVRRELRKEGKGDELDLILEKSRSLDHIRTHLVMLAKSVSSTGPITFAGAIQNLNKVMNAALDYCMESTNLRNSHIVEDGLKKFDLENPEV
jgi:hypothetical protein